MPHAKVPVIIVITVVVIALFTFFSKGIAEQQAVVTTTVSINVSEAVIQYLQKRRAEASRSLQQRPVRSVAPSDSTITIGP